MDMEINKKRYRDLDSYLKLKFKKKILKLPIDGGFTCPNRDGTLGKSGCIYCSARGSGEWTFAKLSIKEQISRQKIKLSQRGREEGYLAYFQNFTSTYGSLERMRTLFYEALAEEKVEGLFLATRADCLDDEVVDLLDELNHRTFLVVELGMQSVNEGTISLIKRGYSHEDFDRGLARLRSRGIRTLVHVIVGLPYEGMDDYLRDIAYINGRGIWGIKIHNLYLEKSSKFLRYFEENHLAYTMTKDEYVNICVEMLRHLSNEVVVNRLTGDGVREKIAYPDWSKNKAGILSSIDKQMKENDYRQGDLCQEN